MAVASRPLPVKERQLLPDLGIECLDAAWGWVELLQSQESYVTRETILTPIRA